MAANAMPEAATRHGWREIMRASASNIVGHSLLVQPVGKLCVEVGAPGVEADPESQDLQAHRTWHLQVRRLLRSQPARGIPVAPGHAAGQLDSRLLADRVGKEQLQQHLVSELDG